MTGLKSLGGLGAASRAAASAAESPSPGANASKDLYPLPESDTPTPSAESPTNIDARPSARTLGDFSRMTPGAADAYADALRERVEKRPFESKPLLPRTPVNAAAAAAELGAKGDAQPAELGQPGASDSPRVEPAEVAVAEVEASERPAGEQEFVEAGRVEEEGAEQEGAAEAEIAEAEGADEAEIADEGAEEMEEEVRIPRWGGKSGRASLAPDLRVQCWRSVCRRAVGRHQDATHALLHTHTARTPTCTAPGRPMQCLR